MKKLLVVMMLALLAFFAVGCGENSYTVTYMADGEVYEITEGVAPGTSSEFPAQPSKTGYRFTGWYEEGAEEPFSEDTAIDGDLVLYAGFDENEYTLTFSANGGTGSMDSVSLTYTQEYKLPACAFTNTDNLFVGWALSADGEAVYNDEATISKLATENDAAVTLYAVWDSQSYTVVFNGNGGLGAMEPLTVAMSREFSLTRCAFVKQGWHFAGWALSAEGEIVYDDGETVSGLASEKGATVDLYAIWEQDSYTVKFDKNDAAATGTMADQIFALGEEKALPRNAFSKTGFNFMGWALSADGEVVYEDGETVSGLATEHGAVITLYAVFRGAPETYTITTRTEQADGSFKEDSQTKNGYFGDVITVTADPITGYTVGIAGNGAKLDGGDDTVITVTYSLTDYTAKLIGVYGEEEFEVDSQTFTYLSEKFSLEALDRVEVSGVAYRYIDKGVSLEIAENTSENVTIEVEYGIEVTDAAGLVSAMRNNADKSVVLANDIDMRDYLTENPWNSTVTENGEGAFFNRAFSGTLDGKGHSILNLNSTAGLIARYTNTVFKEISENGTVKNLHMQISVGLSAGGEGARMGLLFGDMYGTIDNCFFEVDAQFNVDWYMYGAAPIYNLGENSKVTNTVFYIPNAAGLRMICSTSWGGAFEGYGIFDNVAFVYGDSSVNNSLPNKYNPNITDIYVIKADYSTGTFNDAKVLNAEKYAAGYEATKDSENVAYNSADYWDAVSFEDITAAMSGFTFTESVLKFGDRTVMNFEEAVEVSDAYEFVEAMTNKPWANIVLQNDIDMSEYLAENPWNDANADTGAFFNFTFSGTLDGQGHSILNLDSAAGVIDHWENVVIREISPSGVIKNLHLQVSLGLKATEYDRALLFGNMYGTIENCFFEIDVQTDSDWGYYASAAFYRLAETSHVSNSVFYIPAPVDFRLMCASTGDASFVGTFENVAYVYGGFNYKGLLPDKVNPDIEGIYLIKADAQNSVFTGSQKLADGYAEGSVVNDESLWEEISLENITENMQGFTFTESVLKFGDRTVMNFEEAVEVSDAYEFVAAMTNKPWANIALTNDIDMSDYLAENPWNDTNSATGAFFNFTFSGTLDGQGHSILNLNSAAGVVERWENVVFRELAETGVIKNLHLQASLGVQSSTGDRSYLFGNVYGTIQNCFFEVYPETNSSEWDGCVYYGTGAIYRLKESALIENTVFYVPNPAGFRLIASNASLDSNTGASSYVGTFRNVAYVYGSFDYNNLLPTQVNPGISDIYIIKADAAANSFTQPKELVGGYAGGATVNGEELWTDTTLQAINGAMTGFTFTETSVSFGDKVIVSELAETIEATTAEQLVNSLRYKPWANIKLMNDIDMSAYLAKYPWNNTDTKSGAFINTEFTGTLDGQGHSVLNLDSAAGVIDRWEKNSFIRKISSSAVIKNLHLQLSIGVNSSGQDRAFLIGNMEGTIENCFFEIDVATNEGAGYYGTAAFYTLADTSAVKNTVFYIPAPAGFRLMCASTGDSSRVGTFENVTYIYGSFDYENLLPDAVNPNISGIYLIREDSSTGTFTDAKALSADYAGGSAANGESLWTASTVSDVTAAMNGFTFTEKTLSFGDTIIADLNVA
ncbi:MAG TPA: InlB B-repeat-containing protein [Candidatus Borkfalkia avistercoris]|uniref:InlB B-repeat-containing protein n=1 Tax=Candidatus Borkfalkia avistercoris TaxID=2838504 RepID=A0A9D2IE57_9FIRM|nr:InlB B-repeat-containing protein [Candidatus Borkfalkia avistercoris]